MMRLPRPSRRPIPRRRQPPPELTSPPGGVCLNDFDGEAHGHFRGHYTGHFLSMLSQSYASTGDEINADKIRYLLIHQDLQRVACPDLQYRLSRR
jgi:hypothetical protein